MMIQTEQTTSNSTNKLQLGSLAIPIIGTNLVFAGIAILYYKKQLPSNIIDFFSKFMKFEISKKISLGTIIILISIYIILNLTSIQKTESFVDTPGVFDTAINTNLNLHELQDAAYLKYLLLHASLFLFHNIRVIPFLVTLTLFLFVYGITVKISGKRVAGIIALMVLMQSSLVFKYASSSTYENSWILFYLISLYWIRRWPISPFFFGLSMMVKELSIVFLPASLFFIMSSNNSKKEKIINTAFYGVIVIYSFMRFFAGTTQISDSIVYHMKEFWTGFAIIESSFKFDMIFLILLIPTIIGLFIVSQKGVRQSNTFLLLISSCLLISPLLSGFTHIVNGDYRIIPLIVFFSIGFGLVFVTKTDNNMSKRKFILSSAIFVVTLTLVMVSYVDVIFPHLFHRDFGAYL